MPPEFSGQTVMGAKAPGVIDQSQAAITHGLGSRSRWHILPQVSLKKRRTNRMKHHCEGPLFLARRLGILMRLPW